MTQNPDQPPPEAVERPAPEAEERQAPEAEERPAPEVEERQAPEVEERQAPEVEERPATWENVVVGKVKEGVGHLLHDRQLETEGEDQADLAHEVHEEYRDSH